MNLEIMMRNPETRFKNWWFPCPVPGFSHGVTYLHYFAHGLLNKAACVTVDLITGYLSLVLGHTMCIDLRRNMRRKVKTKILNILKCQRKQRLHCFSLLECYCFQCFINEVLKYQYLKVKTIRTVWVRGTHKIRFFFF